MATGAGSLLSADFLDGRGIVVADSVVPRSCSAERSKTLREVWWWWWWMEWARAGWEGFCRKTGAGGPAG